MAKSPNGRGFLPKHLSRIEEVVAPDIISGCGAAGDMVGKDVSERIDIVPAQFRVLVTPHPEWACQSCGAGIAQATAKSRLIEGGLPT